MTVVIRLWRLALAPEARFGLCTASTWCFLVCDSLSIKPRRLNKPGASRTAQAGGGRCAPCPRRAQGWRTARLRALMHQPCAQPSLWAARPLHEQHSAGVMSREAQPWVSRASTRPCGDQGTPATPAFSGEYSLINVCTCFPWDHTDKYF